MKMRVTDLVISLAVSAIISFAIVYSAAVFVLAVEPIFDIPVLREMITWENYAIGMFVAAFLCYSRYTILFSEQESRDHSHFVCHAIITCWTCMWFSWAFVLALIVVQLIETCELFLAIFDIFHNKQNSDNVIQKPDEQ